MKFTITNPWLSVDRAYEDDEAYLDSVHYLAETAYDEALKQVNESLSSEVTGILLVNTTVGIVEIDLGYFYVGDDWGNYVPYLNEDKLWEVVYEATEYYIKRGEDV